jgi:hypothetical protein
MITLAKALTALAALMFIMAVLTQFVGTFGSIAPPEGFSRACSNLALLAIALVVVFGSPVGRSTPLR